MKIRDLKTFVKYLNYKFFWTIYFQRRIEYPVILEWVQPNKNEKILDLACGDGELSLKIAERVGTVYGIDRSTIAIADARALSHKLKIHSHFRTGDAVDLPYPNNFFDKIVCSSSLEHFREDIKALSEMHRVLKPNGRLILTTDSFTAPIGARTKEKHKLVFQVVNFYTKASLKERFGQTGFETARSRYLLTTPISRFFIASTVNLSGSVLAYCLASFIACPFVLLAEKISRHQEYGFTIIAEGIAKNKDKGAPSSP
jgi:ubiquinone/menaquinone biosynthesis C-methylase UbiE